MYRGGSTGRTLHRALPIHDLIEGQAEGPRSRNSSRGHHLLKLNKYPTVGKFNLSQLCLVSVDKLVQLTDDRIQF